MANHKGNGSSRSAEPEGAPATSRAGYRNPPLETRFAPGQSGNRRGRPRGAKGHKQIVRKIANEMHSVVEDGNRRKRSTSSLFSCNCATWRFRETSRHFALITILLRSILPKKPGDASAIWSCRNNSPPQKSGNGWRG